MRILQLRNKKWYLNRQRIVSSSNDLSDVIICKEKCSYATMHSYYMVMESYEESHECLMGCYTALIRFYEFFTQPTRYVWINSDADSPVLDEKFGKNKAFIGKLSRQDYREVKEEIKKLGGRCLVLKKDWIIQFRDNLILTRC